MSLSKCIDVALPYSDDLFFMYKKFVILTLKLRSVYVKIHTHTHYIIYNDN